MCVFINTSVVFFLLLRGLPDSLMFRNIGSFQCGAYGKCSYVLCVYACVWCVRVCVCVHMCVCIHVHCMCVHLCVCICVHMCFVHTCVHAHVCVYYCEQFVSTQ